MFLRLQAVNLICLMRFEVGTLELTKIIDKLESSIQNPSKGLPEEVFLFVSRVTPLINVDLLIKNERNQTLLTWRADNFLLDGISQAELSDIKKRLPKD